jgi:hypothetical protein
LVPRYMPLIISPPENCPLQIGLTVISINDNLPLIHLS